MNKLNTILLINLCKIKRQQIQGHRLMKQRLNLIFKTWAVVQNSKPLNAFLLVWISTLITSSTTAQQLSHKATLVHKPGQTMHAKNKESTTGWPSHTSTERMCICISRWQHPHSSHFPITCRKLHNTSNRSGDGHTLLHHTVKADSIEKCNL